MLARLPIILALLALSACAPAVLDPAGPITSAEKTLLFASLAIMLAIVAPTILATLGFAWWFRASNSHAKYLPTWAFSGRIEMIVWSIPLLVIMLLGGVAWISAHALAPERPLPGAPLSVKVVSLDWKWLFIYPKLNIASVNDLVVPQGQPVSFELTSASVMNAFFIPQLGGMIYTMNGMVTHLNLQADQAGTYHGLSSHYSGDGFSDMHFTVRVLAPADYAAWATHAQTTGATLDEPAYKQLARQGTIPAPVPYRNVDPTLFAGIVSQRIAPSGGPTEQ